MGQVYYRLPAGLITEQSRKIHSVDLDITKPRYCLFLSDIHIDSTKCDIELLTKHLKQAEEREAFVHLNGDVFDLMQGKYDPRRNKQELNNRFNTAKYLDEVIEYAYEYFTQFKLNYLMSYGNHETGIVKNLETDPLQWLEKLMTMKGHNVFRGAYEGYIRIKFYSGSSKTRRGSHLVYYHHGKGGNAPRSKGILNVDLDSKNHPDARIIVTGHTHQKWQFQLPRERVNDQNTIFEDVQHHLKTGSYKRRNDSGFGWEIQKGFDPTKRGGYWVVFSQASGGNPPHISIEEAD